LILFFVFPRKFIDCEPCLHRDVRPGELKCYLILGFCRVSAICQKQPNVRSTEIDQQNLFDASASPIKNLLRRINCYRILSAELQRGVERYRKQGRAA
jgi:hypothetical protein